MRADDHAAPHAVHARAAFLPVCYAPAATLGLSVTYVQLTEVAEKIFRAPRRTRAPLTRRSAGGPSREMRTPGFPILRRAAVIDHIATLCVVKRLIDCGRVRNRAPRR